MKATIVGLGVMVAVLGYLALDAVSEQVDSRVPQIEYHEGTPGDVMALGDTTWADLLERFPRHHACLTDVTVSHNWDLGMEAGFYQPGRDHIEIEVPNSRRAIRSVYLHEFGHHLDFRCADRELRRAFMIAQGHDPEADWFSDFGPWAGRPSEQFAEAVVAVVGGGRLHPDVRITPSALRVVESWADG